MQVKVKYTELPTIHGTQNFSIVLTSPCLTDTLTLDTSLFASPALIYTISDPASVFSWTDAAAKSVKSLTNCGTLTWVVTKEDGVAAVDSIFILGDLTLTNKSIHIFTNDMFKADTYKMQVKSYYTLLPTI
jgi:hypothetical protein